MSRASGYSRNGWAWQATVKRVLDRDEHRCYGPFPAVCAGHAITADHVIPVSQGGSHDDSNLAAICKPCHDVKTEGERRAGIARRKAMRTRPREQHPNHPAR